MFVDDPVSGLAFVLDPASKSADKVHRSREFLDQRNAEDDGARIMIKSDSEEEEQGAAGRMLIKFRDEHSGDSNTNLAWIHDDKRDVVKEDLETRNIQGVECNGTRTTTTIPAGGAGA